ncbi:transcription factor bHLH18-like [Gastrolobium bilobum]|uniref:transcription factor bHLH18-like n=1 Tax=Gastrolobium bilobum TaxID=150636 RepID=UPI002AB0AAD5|nr:transcription factor bHLH18-like [Gastrolobium bilobum]
MTSMEESWTSWLCDMEADDFINQPDKNFDDGSLASHCQDIASALQQENPQRAFSTESHCSYATFNIENTSIVNNNSSVTERPSEVLNTCSTNSQKRGSFPWSYILSFDNANTPSIKVESALKQESKVVNHKRPLPSKNELRHVVNPHHTHDHIIAERKRREKISQLFIALSALIPGLQKMDKASVLGDAIKYVKVLKEQVKQMEEQSKRRSVESVVFVKKSQLSADDDVISDTSSNSCDGNSDDPSKINLSLPEVEARVSEKNVLIRIHCQKEKATLLNIFREIEKLHLSVINNSAFYFGSSVLVVTVIAEMEGEFNMSVNELAKNIRVGLMQFM